MIRFIPEKSRLLLEEIRDAETQLLRSKLEKALSRLEGMIPPSTSEHDDIESGVPLGNSILLSRIRKSLEQQIKSGNFLAAKSLCDQAGLLL